MAQNDDFQYEPPSLLRRVDVALGLIIGLRGHDFRAASTFVQQNYAQSGRPAKPESTEGHRWTA